jgi:hypothetical protein
VAETTVAARLDDHFITFGDIVDTCSNGRDHPRRFVTGNEWKSHVTPNAFNGLEVGRAEATGPNSDQDFAWARCGRWNFLQLEPMVLTKDSGDHDRVVACYDASSAAERQAELFDAAAMSWTSLMGARLLAWMR